VVKSGVRALGIAESFRDDRSTLAGVVVRASRVVDGFGFARCTVGGMDATSAITGLYDDLDREDVQYVLLAGVALAWYNIVDLAAIAEHADRPVIAVTFESSEGLDSAIEREFEGTERERRLVAYRALPERVPLTVNEEQVFVRAVGVDDEEAARVVAAFTPEGGRPEPVRVARQAARAADAYARGIPDA